MRVRGVDVPDNFEEISEVFYEKRSDFFEYHESVGNYAYLAHPGFEDDPEERKKIYKRNIIISWIMVFILIGGVFVSGIMFFFFEKMGILKNFKDWKDLLIAGIPFLMIFGGLMVVWLFWKRIQKFKKGVEILNRKGIDPDLDPIRLEAMMRVYKWARRV